MVPGDRIEIEVQGGRDPVVGVASTVCADMFELLQCIS